MDLSFWHFRNDRLNEAEKYTREADRMLKEMGSTLNNSSIFYADIAWATGKYEEAESIYMEAQERLGLLGEKNLRSGIMAVLGLVTMELGKLDQAQAYLEQALATARELENTRYIAYRLPELSNVFYRQGKTEKFKQFFRECVPLTKALPNIQKVHSVVMLLQTIYKQNPRVSVRGLGSIDVVQKEERLPLDPVRRLYWNRIEVHAREALGDAGFESALAEGQKMSLDDALDLTLKTVEEM
jgi:tetratricopeptide (TPR) repeat protein